MRGYQGQDLRFANAPHDEFEWQGMIAGESRFAIFEPRNTSTPKELQYDVLRLLNTPQGLVIAPDERGLYIARSRSGGDTVMFKMVDNPNHQHHQQSVTQGESLVDDDDRVLVRRVTNDPRAFIPLPLTPEETMAASVELELAAQVYQATGNQ